MKIGQYDLTWLDAIQALALLLCPVLIWLLARLGGDQ